LKKPPYAPLIFLLPLLVFFVQYFFRFVDDNRLTSWRWAFDIVEGWKVYGVIAAGIVPAYLLSRLPRPPSGVLFLLSFAVSAVFWREPEVIVDASRYFTQAKHLEMFGVKYFLEQWGAGIDAWTDLPVVPFFYGLVFRYIGESRLYLQVFTTSLFSLTVVLTSLIGRDLWDEEVGSTAGLLLLGMPYVFSQVPLMLVDVPSMFLLTLSVFAFGRAVIRGGAFMTALAASAVFLALFSKYSLWLMLTVLLVLLLVRMRDGVTARPADIFRRGVLVFLLAAVFGGAFLLYKYEIVMEQMRLLIDYQKPGLRRWTESFTSTFLFQIHPFITAGALYSIYAAAKKRDVRYVAAAWLVLVLVLFQVERIRYAMPAFPMISLMAAYGMNEIKAVRVRRFLVYAAVLSSVAVAVFAYLPMLERLSMRNLMDAGAYMDTLGTGKVRVYTLPQKSAVNPAVSVPLLDLLTEKDLLYDYEPSGALPSEKIRKSPLRFTWRYKNPEYYRASAGRAEENFAVVISGRAGEPLPSYINDELSGFRAARVFGATIGLFRFQSVVTVYRRAPS
jgi:4-amino-4-deoxy-L-arabinose transferase-like glycosyltransferase